MNRRPDPLPAAPGRRAATASSRTLLAAAASLLAAAALAQTDDSAEAGGPWRFGAGVRLGHDDNVYRAAERRGSGIATARVFATLDERIARQRLRGQAELSHTRYASLGELDHRGHRWLAAWDGATVGAWSWSLQADGQRRLADYDTVVDAGRRVPDVQTLNQARAALQRGLRAQWVARLAVHGRRIGHSSPEFAADELRQQGVEFGVVNEPLGPLVRSAGVRVTRGRYPQAIALPDGGVAADRFRRRDLDLGLRWAPGGATEASLRLSATRQTSGAGGERSFSGLTGQASGVWQVTAKTRLAATLLRDTGSEASFVALPADGPERSTSRSDASRTTTSLGARAEWEATAKITLALSGWIARRELGGDGVADGADETSRRVALAVRWQPTRLSAIGCQLAQQRRSGFAPYRARLAHCSAEIAFEG